MPSTFTTGYRYAGLGYTTVFDAAVAPIAARQTHAEFDDTPIIDSGFFALLGNDEYLHRQIAAGEAGRVDGQADEHRDPFGGIADERHLGFGQGAVEIPADERELGAEQPDAGVFYRKEPGQLLGFGPVA